MKTWLGKILHILALIVIAGGFTLWFLWVFSDDPYYNGSDDTYACTRTPTRVCPTSR